MQILLCGTKSILCNMKFHLHHKSKSSRNFTNKFSKIKASNNSDNSKTKTKSKTVILAAQSAIAVLGLGFVDAGYSGDWSRIGVISKETEDVLKFGALLVIPLCLFLIFSLSKTQDND